VGKGKKIQDDRRLLVFPDGTVHDIHFLRDDENTRDHDDGNPGFDSVVFGGRKLSFCSLLGEKMTRRDVNDPKIASRVPCLTMSDWVWNVKTFRGHAAATDVVANSSSDTIQPIIMVVGFARHFLEVWKISSTTENDPPAVQIHPICLHRLYLEPSTMATSMDMSWNDGRLRVASGTSFFKIWVTSVVFEDDGPAIQSTNLLEKHGGVVHAVHFTNDDLALASTSDDRSVRMWTWDDALQTYNQQWVGWGHAARVWSVCFAGDNDSLVVSVSEDGTARIWCGKLGDSLACVHHAAQSGSLWTVDALGDFMVMGATDGVISTHDLANRIRGRDLSILDSLAIPDDRPKESTEALSVDGNDSQKPPQSGEKKKKKKRKKIRAQVIVGMKWWKNTQTDAPRLLVATREGSLYSLDTTSQKWEDLHGWWNEVLSEKYGILSSDGCCMAIQPNGGYVAFGTTKGYVVLIAMQNSTSKLFTVLNGNSQRSVNGMTWTDTTTLVSFHVQTVVLWELVPMGDSEIKELTPSKILTVDTKGVPMSCAYNLERHQLVVGDSRGSILLFSTKGDNGQIMTALSVFPRAHQKEHVSSLRWINNFTIISGGNDGSYRISYVMGDSLCQGWSFAAPLISGVTSIRPDLLFDVAQSPVIATGYHGNIFRMIDARSGYESINVDTGGRQRILDCMVEHVSELESNIPTKYSLVVCMSEKDGSNSVFIQQVQQHAMSSCGPAKYPSIARGVKLHGETIFGSTMFSLMDCEVLFLVTASEDCTTRISAWENGSIIDALVLDPQVSCVRCVSSSQIDKTSVLLVIGGGKLMIQFFLVQAFQNKPIRSVHDLRITYLGRGTAGKKEVADIDQRFNAVKAMPLDEENRVHLAIAGDSNGYSHIFLLPECAEMFHELRSTVGAKVKLSDRPILSIEAVSAANRILVLIGTTKGDLISYDLAGSYSQLREEIESLNDVWTLVDTCQVHQMGTNTITASVSSVEAGESLQIAIASGGDDHSLCFTHLSIQQRLETAQLCILSNPRVQKIPGASCSAIKSVSHVTMEEEKYILSAGYSQTLSLWQMTEDGNTKPGVLSTVRIDLGDVNCMAVCRPSEVVAWVAACGMGVEMFKLCSAS
jgi:WD40 repeat protein